ncbi:hypothetical protein [Terriglobus roseus]|uniref:Uncharacterized protein n=1 Tax=Terriglobus roseus TaxID=392734 RepID=A0A1H4TQY3_9BACT|nr:hypothetical protein [Terriglobus roseus]SEC58906.1 hypothetical protein SAMN05443244_3833 [Terriglobus roseus]
MKSEITKLQKHWTHPVVTVVKMETAQYGSIYSSIDHFLPGSSAGYAS